jgi:ankyrin repeat protein
VVDEFLRAKVPVDLLNRQRETPLDVAASAGQLEAMDRLIQAGADTRLAGQR